MNTTAKINVGEHRLYEIVNYTEFCTIVKDTFTKEIYKCHFRIYCQIGDTVRLFIKSINDDGSIYFVYSILNSYEEGKEYEFDIKEEQEKGFVIEDNEYITHFYPFKWAIEFGLKKIKSVVKKLNIERNQLFFAKPITYHRNGENSIKDYIINFQVNIEKFKNEDNVFNPIDDIILNKFPALELINEKCKILSLFNNSSEDSFSKLFRSFETNKGVDESNYQLTKLVLLNNLLALDVIRLFDNSIIKEQILTNLKEVNLDEFNRTLEQPEVELPDNTNFGREDKQREFKSSIVYFAGENEANFEKQIFVILKTIAGFLNSKGGTLLIGVNDEGKIIGLSNDYKHFGNGTNGDKYERIIREEIVKVFKKEINGLIDIKIIPKEKVEYCEISIPEYEKPVLLKDKLYQRQGNETRILTGADFVSFIERKVQNKASWEYNNTLPTSRHNFYEELRQVNNEFSLQSEQKIEDEVLAYLYFFKDGRYSLTKKPNISEYKVEIPISSVDKSGFILLCYNNGCINKVTVRTFLEKTFEKVHQNGLHNDAELLSCFIIKEESLIVTKTLRDNEKYLKVYNSKLLTTHDAIHSKGINILQRVFDELLGYSLISMDYEKDLERIIYSSRQNLGAKLTNNSYKKEFAILDKIL